MAARTNPRGTSAASPGKEWRVHDSDTHLPLAERAALPVGVPAPSSALPRRVDRPLSGILLVLASGIVFSVSDAIAKYLSATLPPVEIACLRWIGFTILMCPLMLRTRGAVLHTRALWLEIARALCVLGSSILFIAGLQRMPLASATTVNFVSPLIVTILSVPLLGEKVGIRRWAAIGVGLVGVVVVVRPGTGSFDAAAVFPLMSASCWAVGMILTRKLGRLDGPGTAMAYTALVGTAVATVLALPVFVTPSPAELGISAVMAGFATAGQFLTLLAFQRAPASLLAPFAYGQLIWSTTLGFAMFGNVPDAWTGIGAAIIIASGLYTAHRERVRAHEARLRADRTAQGLGGTNR